MNKAVLGGFILVIGAVVVVAGLMVFNSMNPNISGAINPVISNDNQIVGNNTNDNVSSPNTLLTLIPFSGSNSQSNLSPKPSPKPTLPPDPMDHIISLFDIFVKSTFPQTNIPGSAVVIVKDNKIVYMNCFGVKNLASGEPVTKDTLFEIGSCSKAFTATNIAQLVSAGLMSWDDPISKYFNDTSQFQLYDSNVTGNITIRDCLSHRSGQPAYSQDMEWIIFNDSYSKMLYNLRLVKNDTAFNTTYNYNNIIYALPGYCAAKVTNTTWSELIKDDLLTPLSMTTATSTVKDFFNSPDHITPYMYLANGTIIPYHTASIDEVGPAGVLGCSISEMANWLKFQISDTGYYNGQKIVNKSELDETRTGQINYTSSAKYGFGWVVTDNIISHAGDTISSQTSVAVFPSKGIGIVSLTNIGPIGMDFNNALLVKLALLLKGDETTDPWLIYKDQHKPLPFPDPAPPIVNPLPLGTYAGVYSNYLYGNITITENNNTLKCYYGNNNQSNNLEHWNGNVFVDKIYQAPFNFTDIHNGSAHQLEVTGLKDYNTIPANEISVFNRTNST